MFEAELNSARYPHLMGEGSRAVKEAKLQLLTFGRLFTTWHMFKRTATAGVCQFFQQTTGIDAIVRPPFALPSSESMLTDHANAFRFTVSQLPHITPCS